LARLDPKDTVVRTGSPDRWELKAQLDTTALTDVTATMDSTA